MSHQTEGDTLPDFDSLWDYDQPAETERKFRELIPAARTSGDNSYLAELLTQIARTEGLQGRFEDAHHTLDEVEGILPKAQPRARVRYLLERGRVLNSSGKPGEAKHLFLEAWELGRGVHEDALAVDAAHMVAIVETPELALEWNLRGLDLAEKSSNARARKWTGSLYNNIGWTYFDQKQYGDALDAFQKALEARKAEGKTSLIRIGEWSVAKALRLLNRADEALKIQNELLQQYEGEGTKDGYVYEELAECYLAKQRLEEARRFFGKAFAELSKDRWLAEHEPDRLRRLEDLGRGEQLTQSSLGSL